MWVQAAGTREQGEHTACLALTCQVGDQSSMQALMTAVRELGEHCSLLGCHSPHRCQCNVGESSMETQANCHGKGVQSGSVAFCTAPLAEVSCRGVQLGCRLPQSCSFPG